MNGLLPIRYTNIAKGKSKSKKHVFMNFALPSHILYYANIRNLFENMYYYTYEKTLLNPNLSFCLR